MRSLARSKSEYLNQTPEVPLMQSAKRDFAHISAVAALTFACALAWGSPFVSASPAAAVGQSQQQPGQTPTPGQTPNQPGQNQNQPGQTPDQPGQTPNPNQPSQTPN